jgi:hypothetical protein
MLKSRSSVKTCVSIGLGSVKVRLVLVLHLG